MITIYILATVFWAFYAFLVANGAGNNGKFSLAVMAGLSISLAFSIDSYLGVITAIVETILTAISLKIYFKYN